MNIVIFFRGWTMKFCERENTVYSLFYNSIVGILIYQILELVPNDIPKRCADT